MSEQKIDLITGRDRGPGRPDATSSADERQSLTLGQVELSRVVEWTGGYATTDELFPSLPSELWRQHSSWLAPEFFDAESSAWQANVQTWVLKSAGRTVLVDTGLGNDKQREVAVFHRRTSDFLDRLAAAGVDPQDVDLVINTHLHNDHVGWNTRLVDGEWVPTFPDAQYLINRTEFDYWNPANGHVPRSPFQNATDTGVTFDDSVFPVHRAGQAVLWEGSSHRIDDNLVLELAPGHTPGSAVLHLESGDERAVFVGDIIHTPLQVIHPDHDTCLSEDPARASRSRRRILQEAADTNSLVVPAHLRGPGAFEVSHADGGFTLSGWAPFPSTWVPEG
ncbi:MBL fold metallo-hydrolase [Kineococcus gypseus]|uniref:MBL fold metallo-hydrolase n=1 Tax=Kineococcus gypseus TaxID=1637102 RepID=UPI003D7C93B9